LAKIISLPSEGLYLPGKVLNLSVGGCGIQTVSSLPAGTRAEIILHVNAASIRALGEIRAPRGPNVVGVEFLMVSAGAKYLLEDLILQLVREQATAALRKKSLPCLHAGQIHEPQSAFWDDKRDVPRRIVSLDEAVAMSVEPRVAESAAEPIATLVYRELDLFI
jgi:hypothetical protein